MFHMRVLIFCVAWAMTCQGVALAGDAAPPTAANCNFITNDCEICSVDDQGKVACSTQGIACTPTRHWCLVDKDGRKAANE